ncbi:MAG: hypothetical protein IPK16_25315 [Anaerolineales bacterium]|nr:hypothetical protein [Anaerolineales bacterium]
MSDSPHKSSKPTGRRVRRTQAMPTDAAAFANAQTLALYLAKAVRDAMEDVHARYIPDAEMPALNRAVRNALCTALYAGRVADRDPVADQYMLYVVRSIPPYWEPPVLEAPFGEKARAGDDPGGP